MAIALAPVARAPNPNAIELSPLAKAFGPIATAFDPVATESGRDEFEWKYLVPFTLMLLKASPTLSTWVVVPSALLVV